jgi:hypothetical protein
MRIQPKEIRAGPEGKMGRKPMGFLHFWSSSWA